MKNVLFVVVVVAALCAACYAGGQKNTISVSGKASAYVPADRASISFGVVTRAETAGEAARENAAKSEALFAAIKAQGVDPKDIRTENYSVEPIMKYPKDSEPVVTGYRVSDRVTVRTQKIDKLGALIDAATGAGSNDIGGITFYADNTEDIQRQALADAVKDAKAKAEAMAAALGAKVGKVISMNESYTQPRVYAKSNMLMAGAAMDSAPATEVFGGDLEVGAQVNIVFEIIE